MELSPLSEAIPNFDGAPTLQGFDGVNPQFLQEGVPIKTSSRQYVKFYLRKVPVVKSTKVRINEKTGQVKILKTEVQHVEKEFVTIVTPGDKNVYDNVATEVHKREFWPQYQAFRDGKVAPIGKDLDECEYIPASVVTEMKYMKCFTEEQLADASDNFCDRVPDGHVYREFARAMCLANKKLDPEVSALKNELANANQIVLETRQKMRELEAMLVDHKGDPLIPEEKKSRGRPRKE